LLQLLGHRAIAQSPGRESVAARRTRESVDSSKTLVIGRDRPKSGGPLDPCPGGRLLERYQLLERLGAGGFGTVWRAHDEQLDRVVALKRIPLPSEEDRERAAREAHVTARLAHPAIVALYEANADADAFYLISELVEGDTLALLIAEDELCDEELLEIGLALCAALGHAHARGVIHRDVKPHNVLVPRDAAEHTPSRASARPPAAKLADFGGARLAGDDALTRTGDVLGTLAYMAPEQCDGEEADATADLYSLALVLYEALSGVNPVRGRTPAATARRIGAPIEPLERRRRDLPHALTRALDVALDPDPESRGTLADLNDALADALERRLKRGLFTSRRSPRPAPPLAAARPTAYPPPRDHPRSTALTAGGDEQDEDEQDLQRPRRRGVALPRLAWIGCLLAAAVWQAAAGRPGVSLLLLAAGAPLLALPRRSGPGWIAAALAPVLGLAGLAGAFPALAGQRAGWRARASLAALGFWWLALAESLVGRRLWLGPPTGVPPRSLWESSLSQTAMHVVAATFTLELLLAAAVWALAAAILPWVVRGHSAALDVLTAFGWTIALLAATPLLDRALLSHASQPSPRGALLGAALGCVLAVCARALRGPV
jgi:serine/threonine protein kinase